MWSSVQTIKDRQWISALTSGRERQHGRVGQADDLQSYRQAAGAPREGYRNCRLAATSFRPTSRSPRVRLDPRTGFFNLLDYVVGHDAGRVLIPMIVAGQIVGGVIDGIGDALYSEIAYDENGQFLTGSLADYLVATAADLPRAHRASGNAARH
jgi:CO/xanthine dehydrogenase Mo-binding subunit